MSTPTKRHTKSAVRKRRSHHALTTVTLTKCKKCGKAVKQHSACDFCGAYKGREVVKVAAKKSLEKKKK